MTEKHSGNISEKVVGQVCDLPSYQWQITDLPYRPVVLILSEPKDCEIYAESP